MLMLAKRPNKSFSLLKILFVSVVLCCLVGVTVAQAQSSDTAFLESLKKQNGFEGTEEIKSPLDQSRQRDRRIEAKDQEKAAEEREKLEAEAAEDLKKPSLLENDYQQRIGVALPQFGYGVFLEAGFQEPRLVTGSIGGDYVLGVDDELIITFTGAQTGTQTTFVDREGNLYIEDLAPIAAAGKRFSALEAEIKEKAKEAFIGTEVYVSLASVRSVSVYVFGEVRRPGLKQVTSLASAFEVLTASGGIKKDGSLRNIQIISGGESRIIDLYSFLLGGKDQDLSIRDGDRIVVPSVGATIAISGNVKRPGIYELPAQTGVLPTDEAIALSGGTIRPRGYDYLLNTMTPNGHQIIKSLEGVSLVGDGDIISVSLYRNTQSGQVALEGSVRAGGRRSLDQAPTVNGLVVGAENLKPSTYLPFAVMEVTNPNTLIRELKAFNLEDVLKGNSNILLKDDDRVIIFNRKDIAFLSSNKVRRVLMGEGYLPKPPQQDLAMMTGNADVMSQTVEPAQTEDAEICQSLAKLNKIVQDSPVDRFPTALRSVFIAQTRTTGGLDSYAMQDKYSAEEEKCPDIFEKTPELLIFTLEHVVTVDGAVRMAGVYPVSGKTSVSGLLSIAGGVSEDADLTNVEVLRTDESLQASDYRREKINALQTNLSVVDVSLGGGLRVNSRFTQQERGTVLLSGEVKYPGVYTIRRGERLSELLTRAGGLTDQAYPYGAVFTRERVKQTQRQELRRSQALIRSALMSAMTKKDASAELIAGAQVLLSSLSDFEAIGRVVIEADPEKLKADASLDTVLEPGDLLHLPKRPNYIVAVGDVLSPGAFRFEPGKSVDDYIEEVGGLTSFADKNRVYIVYPNGVAKPVNISSWGFSGNVTLPPGTTIVVPTDVSPYDTLLLVKEFSTVFSQLAVSAASIAVITR